jgi:ubiquinone/menaquinone biosynthesis C-methylase UbiE
METESYAELLMESNPLREPILREMIKELKFPHGSRGLDAGCGIGLQCLLLAEEVGPTGHVTGLDMSPDHIDYGREMIRDRGLTQRISFQEGDITKIPFENNTFDWAWSVDCAGFVPPEPLSSLSEMVRVTKPGGIVAIAAWSSERLLPGYLALESRLGATSAGLAPFVMGEQPEWHFHRALGWFRKLGLTECSARVFARGVCAPLSEGLRNALAELIRERWPNVENELLQEDLAEFRRLCLPGSPDFILNLPDYYAFFAYSMFWGKVNV